MAAQYDYLTFTLARGAAARTAFLQALRGGGNALAMAGAELLGPFLPQLGFASNEAVALIRWPHGRKAMPQAIGDLPHVARRVDDRLTPTVRPADGATLKTHGGIYVHRWFTVDGDRVADFVDLSNRAWTGFEGSYDTEIFGLFTAEPNENDKSDGSARLLLLTWYGNHGVWEASREQAHDPAGLFAKRHLLTRSTIGRSSVLMAS